MEPTSTADPTDRDVLAESGWTADLLDSMAGGPDPVGALQRLADLARAKPDYMRRSAREELTRERLMALAGASRALMMAITSMDDDPQLVDDRRPPAGIDELRSWVATGLARVASEDLCRVIAMPEAGRRVATIADIAAQTATNHVLASTDVDMSVIAMGKWGGRELNYASDIDLLFVHRGDDADAASKAAARIFEILSGHDGAGTIYRVDADLRPEGAAGPLSRTLDSYQAYWAKWAETWELQALIKARHVAGSGDLASEFLAAAQRHVYPTQLGADAVRSIRAMKLRSEDADPAGSVELKRGVGGIRDIEFAVQLMQLVHGRADEALRTPSTLDTLDELARRGYVHDEDALLLKTAYTWLRDAEHRIQLYDMRQTHRLPTDRPGLDRLARAMGYRDEPSQSAIEALEADVARWRREVRLVHERLFHQPVLDALADSPAAAMDPEAATRQLTAFGFLDTEATRTAVTELTHGLSRRSSMMRHMMPLVMEWLSLSPDPDLGLTQLRLLLTTSSDASALVTTVRDDPATAERLCMVLGTSRTIGSLIDRLPPMIPELGDDEHLEEWPARSTLVEEARRRSAVHSDAATAIQRFHAEHLVRIAIADIAGLIDEVVVGHRLADLADATVAGALVAAGEGFDTDRLAVVALGKWGGRELTYPSDLDAVVAVDDPSDMEAATRVVERTVALLGGAATGMPSLELDLELRPEGRKGPLVRSLDSYRSYYEQWVDTWELQAMLRARPAAGSVEIGNRLIGHVSPAIAADRPGREQEIRMIKARVESERLRPGDDPEFNLKLGRGGLADIEWTAQLLQMRHGGDRPEILGTSTLATIEALRAGGLLEDDEASNLAAAYRYCARVRNRAFLVRGRSADSLPVDPLEATRLSRALGYTRAPRTAMREDYRRHTRRARAIVERRFYGMGGEADQVGPRDS